MIREAELEVLGALRIPATISELADRMGRSQNRVSEIVSGLSAKGLVLKQREGRSKRIVPTESKAVELYHDIITRYGHTDPPKLLAGKGIELLYYLDEPITVRELAERTDNYRNTVHRRLKTLQNRGIVGKTDSTYVLTEEFTVFHEFATELIHHDHRRKVGEAVDTSTILWEDHESFLFETPEEIEDERFVLTGPRRFQEHGIPLLPTDRRHYLYTESQLTLGPEELICHTLLIDSGPRYQSYCLLLMSAVDIDDDRLGRLAQRYDVSTLVEDLITYLETRGSVRTDSQPSWDEFRELAQEYRVVV